MAAMSTDRVRLRRTGAGEVSLATWVEPDRIAIAEADVVEVNADAVAPLLATGEFVLADGEHAPELRGAALDEALERAGLPRTGSADEKRARLAEHEALDPDADGAGNTDDEQEQDR